MANGRDTGGVGKVAHTGKHQSGPGGGTSAGREDGLQTITVCEQVAHACKLLEQGERHVQVAQLLNVSRRTLERALAAMKV